MTFYEAKAFSISRLYEVVVNFLNKENIQMFRDEFEFRLTLIGGYGKWISKEVKVYRKGLKVLRYKGIRTYVGKSN